MPTMRIEAPLLAALARMGGGAPNHATTLLSTARWAGRTLTVQSEALGTRGHFVVQYTPERDAADELDAERFLNLRALGPLAAGAGKAVLTLEATEDKVVLRPDPPPPAQGKRKKKRNVGSAKREFFIQEKDAMPVPKRLEEGFYGPERPERVWTAVAAQAKEMPTLRAWPQARTWALDPADWAAGGAVACTVHAASLDCTRSHVWGVHVDEAVTATDGYQLAQNVPCGPAPGLDALIPLPAVRALLTLCKSVPPVRMRVGRTPPNARDEHGALWVRGDAADGASWVLFTPCGHPPPDAAGVLSSVRNLPYALSVDVVDLRDLARQEGAGGHLAFLADGSLVAWSMTEAWKFVPVDPGATKDGEALLPSQTKMVSVTAPMVCTTAPSWPMAKMRTCMDAKFLLPLLDRLPKEGRITVRVGEPLDPILILGQVIMPLRVSDEALSSMMSELRQSFAATGDVREESAAPPVSQNRPVEVVEESAAA